MSGKRPGGRTSRVRTSVLKAAGDVLAESGIDGLNLGELALRAGVGKTTVYRRWGTVPAVIADLLIEMAESSLPRVETGSLAGDLNASAMLVFHTLSDVRQGRLFEALIAAGIYDPVTKEALGAFYRTRIDEWAPCVEAAKARGEISASTDSTAVIRAVSAPLYYSMITTAEPLTEALALRASAAAYAAAKAGVFVI